MPEYMIYPISAVSGIGPLWFAQMLWIFSLIIVFISKIDKNKKLIALGKKCNTVCIILLFVFIWIGAQILNMPVLTMYRFGVYFVAFLIGYFILSNDEIQDKIKKIHIPLLIVSLITGVVYTIVYFGKDYSSSAVLKHIFTNAYAWVMVLAILGCGSARMNKETKFTRYMSKSSYGFYVLHYAAILIPCYYLKQSNLPAFCIYFLALIIVFAITPLLLQIIKRIPILQWLVLGIRREKC